jgi:ATP-dependent exoDNAse (exonuclease V) beta subunit
MRTPPADQAVRDQFANELDKNFSVIAAAGAGKTTAITDRIVEMAEDRRRAVECFPRLVVVTFTNRAADEMQQRARQRIFEKNVAPDVLAAFNRAFFGTIHSFCMKLLTAHGHHLGLPPRLELITDDEELWNDFVQRTTRVGHSLSPENRKALLRHVQLRDLMTLGRRGKLPLNLERREILCPERVDFTQLRTYPARKNATRIQASQKAASDWEERFRNGHDFLPLLECAATGRFREIWEETFREFNAWLSCCALTVAGEVQREYRRFRAEHGVVTFDDQIALTLDLTRNVAAISRIRAKDYIVILDEAQDTDPQQFEILVEITRPPAATTRWIDKPEIDPPRPGRFCMVGDFQQSIYKDRADLKQYQRVHDALINNEAGAELKFSVTFRLDQKQVEFVNDCFHEILDADEQVGFITLRARPERLPGQVVRLDINVPELEIETSETVRERAEAAQLAEWTATTDLDKLRARSWDQVAILCPRKKWFAPIADALRRVGIDSQIQSETDVKADSPAHAWFTALLTIMTQPRCGFEIVGGLREIFGISDHDLAVFADCQGDRFQIETPTGETDAVSNALDLLANIHSDIADKPLFSSVRRIVDATHLRERLRILPIEDFDDLEVELDVLLESAATAEAEGRTLEEFAALLRANFPTEREARTPRPGAIQLITCQKAKGLEWDAVIVPFFSHRVHTLDENFPRIIVPPHDSQVIVAFSKGDVPIAHEEALKKADVQEMERLLYVALTRARHTLVLATDRELFAKKDKTAPSASLTTWFRSDQGQLNEPHLLGLETTPAACNATRSFQLSQREAATARTVGLPRVSIATAREKGAEFRRRLTPSSFTRDKAIVASTGADKRKETEVEFRATTVPSPATRYGIWWHELMQQMPWSADPDAWDELFERAQASSPDRARSVKEWRLFRKNVSKLAVFNGNGSNLIIARAEMPFLWAADQRRCVEGVIDLALFSSSAKKCFLLDWKTNEIKPDKIDKLRAHYLPQLAAYWKAVSEISERDVEAAIYSTAAGELIRYTTEELAREWSGLEKLPPDKFDAEVETEFRSPALRSPIVTRSEQLELL